MARLLPLLFLPLFPCLASGAVKSVAELKSAAARGGVIELAAGIFPLDEPLFLTAGTTLQGAGIGKSIITGAAGWRGNPATLPDPETNFRKFDSSAYLIRLADKADGITISSLTLTGPGLHGAIYGWGNARLDLHDLRFEDFQYCGFRSYQTSHAKIHDCTFVNAGRRWERGKSGTKGGITGGGIFAIWIVDSEIANNRFVENRTAPGETYYGIKGRQGKRLHIHHNTIGTNFSIEFPFENDEDVEIDHNVCHGTISIPKHGGGPVPKSGCTFHIHHNLLTQSYSIEFMRNGVEIDHNLFLFDPTKDGGNLISSFGKEPAAGPVSFHDNVITDPGRGVMWFEGPCARVSIRNNRILASRTATPRLDGLFGFHPGSDFKSCEFAGNVVECTGPARPLFRNDASGTLPMRGNELVNLSDTGRYENPPGGGNPGLATPLDFRCGVDGETAVSGSKAVTGGESTR